jgi:hypothetical protein
MIDWGDVPTWITTLAVGFGAAQLYQDRQSRRQQAEADARRQAQQVAAWAGSRRPTGAEDAGEQSTYGVVIRNDSGLPVRQVEVEAMIHGTARRTLELRFLPPGEFLVELSPNETWSFAVPVAEYPHPVRPLTRTPKYLVTELRFTDAAGRSWRYDADGRLSVATRGSHGDEPTGERAKPLLAPRRSGDGGDGGI